LPATYVDAVRRAGGLPILLPPGESKIDAILQIVDGLILAGGGDIGPVHYNGISHAKISEVDSERDEFELELARRAMRETTPILGICRGLQALNVASGGDLFPHLPEKFGELLKHIDGSEETVHPVEITADSQLARIFDRQVVEVTSKHHQAVNKTLADWRIAARSPDALVEAIEHRNHPWCIAVQWHPESVPEDSVQQKLFEAFVKAARRNRK
jgi:putative glutamine amidotransferase